MGGTGTRTRKAGRRRWNRQNRDRQRSSRHNRNRQNRRPGGPRKKPWAMFPLPEKFAFLRTKFFQKRTLAGLRGSWRAVWILESSRVHLSVSFRKNLSNDGLLKQIRFSTDDNMSRLLKPIKMLVFCFELLVVTIG